jgi:hypothetical protein
MEEEGQRTAGLCKGLSTVISQSTPTELRSSVCVAFQNSSRTKVRTTTSVVSVAWYVESLGFVVKYKEWEHVVLICAFDSWLLQDIAYLCVVNACIQAPACLAKRVYSTPYVTARHNMANQLGLGGSGDAEFDWIWMKMYVGLGKKDYWF